ncbi:MAG TPA: DNA-protecting protein DprA [Candidatus Anaerobiospirillum stercoravium]|nr:DNA-protecting protein DprA [Candidatus Anaerobiospirillum stercoravium]
MALTAVQLMALQRLPRIGKKTARTIGTKISGFISDAELCAYLPQVRKVSSEQVKAALAEANLVLCKSAEVGIGWVGCFDADYPASLREVKSEDGTKDESPVVLFYKGNLALLNQPSVAIIGAREAEPVALELANYWAQQLAAQGYNIVSGLALGCDAAAHRGALSVGGKTTAVLAHGLDSVFPPVHQELAEQIVAQDGILISEYELGTNIDERGYSFVARDLIQAGISQAVLVAQARFNGGSMHASCAAANVGKPVLVGSYDDKLNQIAATSGNRKLVQEFGAHYLGAASPEELKRTLESMGIGPKMPEDNLLI